MEYFNQYSIYKKINPYNINQQIQELKDKREDLIFQSVPRMAFDEQTGDISTYARSVEITAIDLAHIDNRIEKLEKQLEVSHELLDQHGNEHIDNCLRQQYETGQFMIDCTEFDEFSKTVNNKLGKLRSKREIAYVERTKKIDYTHGGKYQLYQHSNYFMDLPPVSLFAMGKKGTYGKFTR